MRAFLRAAGPLALITLLATVSPARAAWGTDPLLVHATTSVCPQVAACEDGSGGAIVVWRENDASGAGWLRAVHVRADGTMDPGWTAPVSVSSVSANQTALQAITDGAGGAFVLWMDSTTPCLQRIAATGTTAAGWPARGLLLAAGWRPSAAMADGAGGLYLAGVRTRDVMGNLRTYHIPSCYVERRGPGGAMSPGWPSSGRYLGSGSSPWDWVSGVSLSTDPSGGLWAAWVGVALYEPEVLPAPGPGAARVARLTANGSAWAGWPIRGDSVAAFPASVMPPLSPDWSDWWFSPAMSLVAVCPDGEGGAFVLRPQVTTQGSGAIAFQPRLHRVSAPATSPVGWPRDGIPLTQEWEGAWGDLGADVPYRLLPDGSGNVFAGYGLSEIDTHQRYFFTRSTSAGATSGFHDWIPAGLEARTAGAGLVVFADFSPRGPMGIWEPYAHIRCRRSNGTWFGEQHREVAQQWYGDIGLATLGDGGAIFAWSQHNQRYGVYAVRFEAPLPQSAPPASPPAPRLALRFAPGSGVRASASFASAGETRFLLADVTGRAVARETFDAAAGDREWTIPGTAALPPGLYFARLAREAGTLTARVVVTR